MKHHYVPAFYLRGFTDPETPSGQEPYLWVVDLNDGTIRRRAPANTAALTDYYAVGDGPDRHAVEEYLAAVESQAAPVINRILCDGFDGTLSAGDKAALSTFTAVQMTRVPRLRNLIERYLTEISQVVGSMLLRSRDQYEHELRKAYPNRDFTAGEIDRLYEGARAMGPDAIRANPIAALGHALSVVPAVARLIQQMSWAIMVPASDENFWTSDNPVYMINPDSTHPMIGHGLAAKAIELNFPIGSRRCLLLTWSGREGRFSIRDLRIAQERGIFAAARHLFCCCKNDAARALSAHHRMHPRGARIEE